MDLEQSLDSHTSSVVSEVMDDLNMRVRLRRLVKSQNESTSMFNRLMAIMEQIQDNYQQRGKSPEMPAKEPICLMDHNYAFSNRNSSSEMSSSTSSPSPTSAPSSSSSSSEEQNNRFNRCLRVSAKRKIIDDDQEYQEFSAEDGQMPPPEEQEDQEQEYPQQIGESFVLGPNGTQVDMKSYNSIIWSSAASATRQLLGFVFTSDVLATHTLTGKPSPAFYGRERPAKMQLDPVKAADIIHCVRSKFKCTEREIRAAITTKCSDTSKKYKRRHQKQLESSNA